MRPGGCGHGPKRDSLHSFGRSVPPAGGGGALLSATPWTSQQRATRPPREPAAASSPNALLSTALCNPQTRHRRSGRLPPQTAVGWSCWACQCRYARSTTPQCALRALLACQTSSPCERALCSFIGTLSRWGGRPWRLHWPSRPPVALAQQGTRAACDQMLQTRPSHVNDSGSKPRSKTQAAATLHLLGRLARHSMTQRRCREKMRLHRHRRPMTPPPISFLAIRRANVPQLMCRSGSMQVLECKLSRASTTNGREE
jgi:hypothetical protein